jgi:hypothetical protein
MNSKNIYIALVIAGVIAIGVWYVFFRGQDNAMQQFAASRPVAMPAPKAQIAAPTPQTPAMTCPDPSDLIKEGDKWTSKDHKWASNTPSTAIKAVSFLGAQWVGIKVGHVICLYQVDEEVSFPVSLEQMRNFSILEPKSVTWSALVGNRKFCKSASIADCAFYLQPPEAAVDAFKEIEYNPNRQAAL